MRSTTHQLVKNLEVPLLLSRPAEVTYFLTFLRQLSAHPDNALRDLLALCVRQVMANVLFHPPNLRSLRYATEDFSSIKPLVISLQGSFLESEIHHTAVLPILAVLSPADWSKDAPIHGSGILWLPTEDRLVAASLFMKNGRKEDLQRLFNLLFSPTVVQWDGISLLCLVSLRQFVKAKVLPPLTTDRRYHVEKLLLHNPIFLSPRSKRTMRQDAIFDVALKVDGHTLPAHRFVLSLNSDYFRTLFASSFTDSRSAEAELRDLTVAEARLLVSFFYGNVELFREQEDDDALVELSDELPPDGLEAPLLAMLRLGRRFLAEPLISACAFQLFHRLRMPLLHELWESVWLIDEEDERRRLQQGLVHFLLLQGLTSWDDDDLKPILSDERCCRDLQSVLLQLF